MTKFIKQRKKWRRLVGRRARVGGGARMQTDRSKKSVPNTHTHIHAQSLDVLKRGKRIKSDDCRREGARANQPPWAYAYKNETKHGKYRTPWFSALERSTSPMRIKRGRSVKGRGGGKWSVVKFHRKWRRGGRFNVEPDFNMIIFSLSRPNV